MNSIFIMANCVRARIADSDARALRADGVRSGDEDQDRFGYRARCDGFWRRSPGQDRDQVPGTRFREDPGESSGASCKDRPRSVPLRFGVLDRARSRRAPRMGFEVPRVERKMHATMAEN